jgi:hypothetical protein
VLVARQAAPLRTSQILWSFVFIGKAGARLPGSCCFADVDDYFDGVASGCFKVTAPLTVRGSTVISFGLAATSAGTSSW